MRSFQDSDPAFVIYSKTHKVCFELLCLCRSESESESALFAKCAQTHEEFIVVFKKLLVHTRIHTYIYTYLHTYISDMRTETFKEA